MAARSGPRISRRALTIIVTAVAAFFALAIPIYVAIRLAVDQGLEAEQRRVLGYATDVLKRSDDTSAQIEVALQRLREEGARSGTCSPTTLTLMRDIDVASSYLQAVGHVRGESIECSSLVADESLELGPVDYTSSRGAHVRSDVHLDFAPDSTFIVVEQFGYAAIVHKDAPIDATARAPDVGLATYSTANNQILTSRGPISEGWTEALAGRVAGTFISGDSIVAVARSAQYEIGSIASISTAYVDDRGRKAAALLVPIGAGAGLVMAGAMIFLARMQLALPAVLRGAFRRKEFFLAYQPVVDLATGGWIGAEVLVRWRRDGGELVSPDVFVPVAEEAGLSRRLTLQVVDLVKADGPKLFGDHPDFHLSINLTKADLQTAETVALVEGLCEQLGARPENIMVEAPERGFLEGETVPAVIRLFRQAGIKMAIDDFGTGYSSLSYLQDFEIDYLKIDKSFVDPLGADAATSQVVFHIIGMAKALDFGVIAEGVETDDQARILKDAGVTLGQGTLFAKPMSIDELIRGLAEQQTTVVFTHTEPARKAPPT